MSDEALRAAAICPYLRAAGGTWRYAQASREHRCTALSPPTVLAADKQRRLCLAARHTGCPTYLAARSARNTLTTKTKQSVSSRSIARKPTEGDEAVSRWQFTRPGPVVLDGTGAISNLVAMVRRRGTVQAGLVAVLVVAFAIVAVTRLPSGGAALGPTPSPSQAAVPSAVPSPTSVLAEPSVEPSALPSADPSPTPTIAPTPTPTPSPPATGGTYVVQSGDTLSGIASRFGTTVAILVELNAIVDPSRIRVGQIIKLP